MSDGKKLLNTKEAAAYLGLSVTTLEKARLSGNMGIPFVRLGSRAIRYRIEDLENYLRSLKSFTRNGAADLAA